MGMEGVLNQIPGKGVCRGSSTRGKSQEGAKGGVLVEKQALMGKRHRICAPGVAAGSLGSLPTRKTLVLKEV